MSYLIAILGLLCLVLMHELGHFAAAKATGMRALRFSIGFPPADRPPPVRRHRVRARRHPARRLRQDPRHAPAGAGRPVCRRRPARPQRAASRRSGRRRSAWRSTTTRRSLGRGRWDAHPRADLERLQSAVDGAGDDAFRCGAAAGGRSIQRVDEALDPRAYWRSSRISRLIVILAGPAMNVLVACFLILTGVALLGRPEGPACSTACSRSMRSPAHAAGLKPGDRLVSANGVHGSVERAAAGDHLQRRRRRSPGGAAGRRRSR